MAKEPDEGPGEILSELLPFEYAEAIGYVVAGWARLEHDIDEIIWSLAEIEDKNVGACLTAQFSTVHARLNALIALARLKGHSEFQIAKLNKFRDHITGLVERRNRIAHDPWLTLWPLKGDMRPIKSYRLHKTARSKLDFDYKPVTLDELKNLRKEIEEAFSRFPRL